MLEKDKELLDRLKVELENDFNSLSGNGNGYDATNAKANVALSLVETMRLQREIEEDEKRKNNMSSRHIGIKGASNSNKY